MKGFKVSQGKKKIVYVYENVITPQERRLVQEYYLPAGYTVEPRVKDVKAIEQRAKDRGFIGEATRADKKTLLAWIKENDSENYKKWEKDFKPKNEGGLGFAKAKANFKREFPKYPKIEAEEE